MLKTKLHTHGITRRHDSISFKTAPRLNYKETDIAHFALRHEGMAELQYYKIGSLFFSFYQ